MTRSVWRHRFPGYAATGLLTLTTTLWTYWGVGELFYEGWWGAWTNRLPYLGPAAICVAFALVSLTWPRVGGWLVIAAGGAFTAWRWTLQAQLGELTWKWMLAWFPISGVLVVIGALFLWEGRARRQRRASGWRPSQRWLRRNARYVVVFAPPLLVTIAVTVFFLPYVLDRFDDGDRGVRRIEGSGVTLVWAPEGPGWNWNPLEGRGRRPSWDDIALYGAPPVGIHPERKIETPGMHATQADMAATGVCAYLSVDGATLLPEPQGIWRMPTADEVVRSLVRRGESAGCAWDGVSEQAECRTQPNKDSPLWAPDESPIYFWTAEEYDVDSAWYVPYTGGRRYGGWIGFQPKDWGNSRHGFRCVREP
jgi:heme/copper-type cytochrome/quinol oxidase subunit 2